MNKQPKWSNHGVKLFNHPKTKRGKNSYFKVVRSRKINFFPHTPELVILELWEISPSSIEAQFNNELIFLLPYNIFHSNFSSIINDKTVIKPSRIYLHTYVGIYPPLYDFTVAFKRIELSNSSIGMFKITRKFEILQLPRVWERERNGTNWEENFPLCENGIILQPIIVIYIGTWSFYRRLAGEALAIYLRALNRGMELPIQEEEKEEGKGEEEEEEEIQRREGSRRISFSFSVVSSSPTSVRCFESEALITWRDGNERVRSISLIFFPLSLYLLFHVSMPFRIIIPSAYNLTHRLSQKSDSFSKRENFSYIFFFLFFFHFNLPQK